MDNELFEMIDRISKRLDSHEYTLSTYVRHQRDGPAMRVTKWIFGLFVRGLFGYAMTIWVPRILGWR